ncbi:hypothetical protein BU17DRAFT_98110 [Hysterangium stoloniferum]|nr:hypothetical protein BU17DRAFT_98110 [Hysterangium stoloniferum]
MSTGTQRSSSSQSANQSSTKKLLRTTTRLTSVEDERMQDREVLEDSTIALILEGVQSGAKKFDLPFAIALLSQIAETANPPLLPALNKRRDVRKCIEDHDELFHLLGECLQKGSFSEIRCLEMLQSDHSEPPHTLPAGTGIRNVANQLSPRLTLEETKRKIAAAFEDFEDYIEYVATGKLDRYFDSIQRHDKIIDLNVHLPLNPILLLHDLGKDVDTERIKKLFIDDTVHLFGASGSGKTRLSLDGLCCNWGLYISCRNTGGPASGSNDFTVATKMLEDMSTWKTGGSDEHKNNAKAAHRIFAMLLFVRIFVLKELVKRLPLNIDPMVARRRWVLVQVLPPRSERMDEDLFAKILGAIRRADTNIMVDLINSTNEEFMTKRKDLFSAGINTPLFVVIDEAQVAADHLKGCFRSSTGPDLRPILHEMYRFFLYSKIFTGIILSGTGLSMKVVEEDVGFAAAAKQSNKLTRPRVFTDVGRFASGDSSQEDYIRRYLTLSENDSDRRLLERMLYWLSGRYRLTASLIELFICFENVPRHRVLTSFVKHMTGFRLTDAIELEDGEPLISPELTEKIYSYHPVCEWKHLFKGNREDLIQSSVDVLTRWTLGSEATTIAIEGGMHEMIAWGVGFLDKMPYNWDFDAGVNYPVYILEPLIVLSLSSCFERQAWTTKKTWIEKSLRNSSSKASLGFVFEEATLFVLMTIFGEKFTALEDAFHCSESIGSRKVTLVSLRRGADNILQSSPVSWNAGSSDRFGFKAKSPTDVLSFLHNPDGKAFLFPDTHMGPDLLCFLQDEETMELIILALQAKVSPSVPANIWQRAIISVTPDFFYTVVGKGKWEMGQYAPKSYPNLINDLMTTLEIILGPEIYMPIVETYCKKLHNSIQAQQQSASDSSRRQTPRFLRIIATPDDEQRERLKAEWKGDLAVLRWDVVRDCIGSMAIKEK